ncbi:hypothetical protein Gotur_009902, partial [Gossypium turneri]
WDNEIKQIFYNNYGDLPYLLDVRVDKCLFRALAQSANVPTFLKKLMCITGMSEQWVTTQIKQKGDSKCIPWKNLLNLILAHPDIKKRVDIFALSIYGLVVFPKALGHVDEAASDLFDRLDKGVTLVPAILAETFRSLNASRRAGEGRFIGCAQLLLVWFHSHFWKVEKMVPDEILYRCGDFDWVPLLGIWGAVRYTPLLVLRQYRSRQFIQATQGLAQFEFSYKDDNYKRKIREISNAWKQVHWMKRFTVGAMTTFEYYGWWSKRVNDNIPGPEKDGIQSIEEHLQVVPSELEIIKHNFEKRSYELGKKVRKGKNKAEKNLDSLKTDYKKL